MGFLCVSVDFQFENLLHKESVFLMTSSSPSALRRKLRKILDENVSHESVRDAGLHSIANVLEENEFMRMEIGKLKADAQLYKKKDAENTREIDALQKLSEPNRWSEQRLKLYEKQFRKVLEMHAETCDKRRKTEARMLLQRWWFLNALIKARRNDASEGNVVEKLEEKIERLEGENEELRIDLLTTENALKRLQLGVKHTMLLRAKEKWDADDEDDPDISE